MKYEIKKGDNLWSLAKRFGTTVDQLARLNGIRNPSLIYAGKELFIPTNMEPPKFIPQEPEITNLALAPMGSPARQPRNPMEDAIQPSGFLGGDPISEILGGVGFGIGMGKATGTTANLMADKAAMSRMGTKDLTLDDLYSLSKYLKPEQMTKLIKNYKK